MNYSTEENIRRRKKSKQNAKKSRNKAGVIIFRVVLATCIIGAFAAAGVVFGAYLGILENAPELSQTQVLPDNYASIVYDADGNEIDRFTGAENREYVKLRYIPENLQNAIVAIEDERFYDHNGVDLKGTVRAVLSTVMGDKQGGSTLTQQLIKNNVANRLSNDVESKLQEQYLAIQYEEMIVEQFGGSKKDAKDYILEIYLNSVSFNHGLYGVQAASHYYFNGKDVSELTLSECAVIAAITNLPMYYTPAVHPDHNRDRVILILNKMLELGFITEEEYKEAYDDDVYDRITQYRSSSGGASSIHDYYSDALIEQLIGDLVDQKKVSSRAEASNLVYNGGLKIYTPKDENMQNILMDAFMDDSFFPSTDYSIEVIYYLSVKNTITNEQVHYNENKVVKSQEEIEQFKTDVKDKYLTANFELVLDRTETVIQPQGAMVIIDYHTGEVKAIMGGRGEKTEDRGFNRATQSKRQPGSVFKILASYAPAIDMGRIGTASVLYDEPYTNTEYNYSPNNWNDKFLGPVTAREGIYNSMNVVTVKNMVETGISACYDYLKQFGFKTLVDYDVRNGRVFTDIGPATALGGLTDGVTQLEVTAAYGTIANGGVYQRPIFYTQVLDHDGNVILENTTDQNSRVVLKNTTAFLLTDMMKDVLTRGTGGKARFKEITMPIAGKTGTSQNTKDLTFVGYTPYYVAGIWLGHDSDAFIKEDAGHHMFLWSHVMEEIHRDLPYKDFERPSGIVSATLCKDSGKLAVSGLCEADIRGSRTVSGLFTPISEPSEHCDLHVSVTIDTATGFLASDNTPSDRRRQIIGIMTSDEIITVNDYEIPESMVYGSKTTRLNSNFSGSAPAEEGEYIIDPETGELIFVPKSESGNEVVMPPSEIFTPTFPTFPTFPNSGGFNTPQPTMGTNTETPPESTLPPDFNDIPLYSEPPASTEYAPIISGTETPSANKPPIID